MTGSENQSSDYSGTEELWLNERCLLRYNTYISARLAEFFSPQDILLDFGAGIGTMAALLAPRHIDCLEPDDALRQSVIARGFSCVANFDQLQKKYDGVYSSNVLEHILDDEQSLRDMCNICKQGGVLSLYLPALRFLYSDFDRMLGHHRRYNRNEIIAKVRKAGFEVISCTYVDSIGVLAWGIAKFFGHKDGLKLGRANSLRFYDRFIFSLSKLIDAAGAKFFFGKNLILIARKK